MWAIEFLVTVLIDEFLIECIIVASKIMLYPWV